MYVSVRQGVWHVVNTGTHGLGFFLVYSGCLSNNGWKPSLALVRSDCVEAVPAFCTSMEASTAIRHVESTVPHICVWASSLIWGRAWFLKVKKHGSFRGVLAFVDLRGGEQGALEKWDSLVNARELPSPSREVGWVVAAWGPCGAFWRHGGARGHLHGGGGPAGSVLPCGVLQLRAARASLRRRALPSFLT